MSARDQNKDYWQPVQAQGQNDWPVKYLRRFVRACPGS